MENRLNIAFLRGRRLGSSKLNDSVLQRRLQDSSLRLAEIQDKRVIYNAHVSTASWGTRHYPKFPRKWKQKGFCVTQWLSGARKLCAPEISGMRSGSTSGKGPSSSRAALQQARWRPWYRWGSVGGRF